MTADILLCTDLDRTLLPNGPQPESPGARELFGRLAERPEVTLVYVSGRHRALLQQAIAEYDLPRPDYTIGDVGTTIYELENDEWRPWQSWHREIAPDWREKTHADLRRLFADLETLQLQEAAKQGAFKLSYYAAADAESGPLLERMCRRLAAEGIRASLIWSIDEAKSIGLLDVLPERATKRHAIEYLIARKGFDRARTVFAGDSGNDLPVLTSGLQAVLVRNAREEVREQALRQLQAAGRRGSLYLAQGSLLGMNGNYAAGVLEGVVHFLPETLAWLEEGSAKHVS